MNTAARALEQSSYLEGRIGGLLANSQMLGVFVILFIVLGSAFAVVYERDAYRHATAKFQQLQYENDELRIEAKQLLIEQTTWATQARVQQIAQDELHMQVASSRNTIMVRS